MKKRAAAGKQQRAPRAAIRCTPTRSAKSPKPYRTEQPYALREPTTGLYAVLGDPAMREAARLDYLANATRFRSRSDALIAASAAGIASQPHEIERIDA